MIENERFISDDCGTLIDMVTRDTYDYVSDVVGLLNSYDKENKELKETNVKLVELLSDIGLRTDTALKLLYEK